MEIIFGLNVWQHTLIIGVLIHQFGISGRAGFYRPFMFPDRSLNIRRRAAAQKVESSNASAVTATACYS